MHYRSTLSSSRRRFLVDKDWRRMNAFRRSITRSSAITLHRAHNLRPKMKEAANWATSSCFLGRMLVLRFASSPARSLPEAFCEATVNYGCLPNVQAIIHMRLPTSSNRECGNISRVPQRAEQQENLVHCVIQNRPLRVKTGQYRGLGNTNL